MFARENSDPPLGRKMQQVDDYDNRCVEIPGVDEMSVEELTQVIVDLYGQIPPSPSSGDQREPT